ncbi:MAG: arylsulfotransferase family protein [Tepidiformaceae bacterium]
MHTRLRRRQFLLGGMAVAGLVVTSTAPSLSVPQVLAAAKQPSPPEGDYGDMRSDPSLNGAPKLNILSSTGMALGDYIFLTPIDGDSRGPAIFDSLGHLVWFRPVTAGQVHNLQVVTLNGQQLLAWYEGETASDSPGSGTGECVLIDSTYTEALRIRGGGGSAIDLHELRITPQGTALVETYVPVQQDLTSLGGAPNTSVLDWLVQEVDPASGAVLFSWRALDHVPVTESVVAPPTTAGTVYDYFHGNSIDVAPDGSLLISARNASTIYKLDRQTGDVTWRLRGGTPSIGTSVAAFNVPTTSKVVVPQIEAWRPAAQVAAGVPGILTLQPTSESFWFQHDARWNSDGTLSLFDDGASPFHHSARALVLSIDENVGSATIIQSYGVNIEVDYEGSARRQANGNWLVGWGSVGRFTEFDPAGQVQLDASFGGNSYRAVRFPWAGQPTDLPATFAERTGADALTVWASWNGSTAVRAWRILAGDTSDSLATLGTFWWQDFETTMTAQSTAALIVVEALDSTGATLATSAPVPVSQATG